VPELPPLEFVADLLLFTAASLLVGTRAISDYAAVAGVGATLGLCSCSAACSPAGCPGASASS
jgi:hypothetical protein